MAACRVASSLVNRATHTTWLGASSDFASQDDGAPGHSEITSHRTADLDLAPGDGQLIADARILADDHTAAGQGTDRADTNDRVVLNRAVDLGVEPASDQLANGTPAELDLTACGDETVGAGIFELDLPSGAKIVSATFAVIRTVSPAANCC